MEEETTPRMPSEEGGDISWFDRFAGAASRFTSRAVFFTLCALLVLVWLPSYFVLGDVDTWQLVINTVTTIITFLLVALVQNTQSRADAALQAKLNAIAAALAAMMRPYGMHTEIAELRAAVGLEDRESS